MNRSSQGYTAIAGVSSYLEDTEKKKNVTGSKRCILGWGVDLGACPPMG